VEDCRVVCDGERPPSDHYGLLTELRVFRRVPGANLKSR